MLLIGLHLVIASAPSLADILSAHRSDKVTRHQYDRAYESLFSGLRHHPIALLEIGVADGHSVASWAEYFTHPGARIVGLAYRNKLQERLVDGRISIRYGDQNDRAVQRELVREGNFTIVIDDGSHVPSHQWNTYEALWPFVEPGGLYVVEDIETNYWSASSSIYGNRLATERNVLGRFKDLVDTAVNSEFSTGVDSSDVESIGFHRNCIIVRKRASAPNSREYRFKSRLRGKKLPPA